jgi:glycosyltransferase involved in cell wall biosynthesis
MRIALVAHGLPPYAVTGVETHTAALAGGLARAGVEVEVFAPRFLPGLAPFAQRREERDGYAVTWLNVPGTPGEDDAAAAFGAFADRERPALVHFQHLSGPGLGALREAARRGLPTVFTAHDFDAVHATYTLLRPDLVRFEVGDDESEARAQLARAWLDGLSALGDHHGCVLREQLDDAQWAQLEVLLDGDPGAHLPAALERVRERAARMRAAVRSLDARYATSRSLARTLSAHLGRAFEWRPAGIELERFHGVAPPRRSERPLRFGFLGGLLKHKGVHTLLDAFARLERPAELHLWGASGDREYVRHVRALAAAAGAIWHGPCAAAELGDVFATFDVLVVPSLWVENAPFVIREAFAARRPVIASDTEPLRESVRADEDGLLVPAGDVEALCAAMRRMVDEDWLLDRLELAVQTPKGIDTEAREWADTYADLVRERAREVERPQLPAHVVPFARRYEAAAALPTRELFDYVTRGLARLGERMGLSAAPGEFLAAAVARGCRLRDDLLDGQRTRDWLTGSVEDAAVARVELERRATWYAEQLEELQHKARWLEEQARGGAEEVSTLERERDWLREERDARGEERDALAAQLAAASEARAAVDRERDWLRATNAAAVEAREALEKERDWLCDTAEHHALELRWLHARVTGRDPEVTPDDRQGREEIERHLRALDAELDALQEHERWLRGELGALALELAEEAPGAPEPPMADALAALVQRGRASFARMREELAWRRAEMRAAREESLSLIARLAGRGLAQRARRWELEHVEESP